VGVFTLIAGLFVLLLLIGTPFGGWDLLRSAIKPKPEDHLRWYDRVLRVVGALMLFAVFVYGIAAIGWR
jgi:hypothetical protein